MSLLTSSASSSSQFALITAFGSMPGISMQNRVTGDAVGDIVAGARVEIHGDVVGSEAVGEIVGELVGSEVVGEIDGDVVGSEVVQQWHIHAGPMSSGVTQSIVDLAQGHRCRAE